MFHGCFYNFSLNIDNYINYVIIEATNIGSSVSIWRNDECLNINNPIELKAIVATDDANMDAVVASKTNLYQILIALSSGILCLLEINNNNIIQLINNKFENEISCIALSPINMYDTNNNNKSLFGAISFWKNNNINIISLPNFQILLKFSLKTDIVSRSLLITTFNNKSIINNKQFYIFAGIGDGSLIESQLKYNNTNTDNNNNNFNNIELMKTKK